MAAGPAACHCIVGDVEGKVFTWGRNEVEISCLDDRQSAWMAGGNWPLFSCSVTEVCDACRKGN